MTKKKDFFIEQALIALERIENTDYSDYSESQRKTDFHNLRSKIIRCGYSLKDELSNHPNPIKSF